LDPAEPVRHRCTDGRFAKDKPKSCHGWSQWRRALFHLQCNGEGLPVREHRELNATSDLVDERKTRDHRATRQNRAGRQYRIGSDPAAVANERPKFIASGPDGRRPSKLIISLASRSLRSTGSRHPANIIRNRDRLVHPSG
jgi:hypothetical protein